ncbi:DUF2653 family protein [Alicyclobacillus macrosporangiidus]|uniref:DUF2653 family protein n=1 Tax=Alicyclobacillus macrosporangiidus TaxID=392015 RepID=UPI000497B7A6|nr:DUF2653 family protein [Alicyclobacillus macrosporangiidus]
MWWRRHMNGGQHPQPDGDAGAEVVVLDEQGVIDACAVYVARRHRCHPQQVQVELVFDPDAPTPFSADARIDRVHPVHLREQDVIDAVAEWVAESSAQASHQLSVDLQYSESSGITATAVVR